MSDTPGNLEAGEGPKKKVIWPGDLGLCLSEPPLPICRVHAGSWGGPESPPPVRPPDGFKGCGVSLAEAAGSLGKASSVSSSPDYT